MEKKSLHVVGLDAIRFLAAILVMLHHLLFITSMSGVYAGERFEGIPDWGRFAWTGFIGVNLFFVLSGFVIAYSAEGSTPARFLRGRFLRIAPMVWLCAALVVMLPVAVGAATPLGQTERLWRTFVFWPTGPWVDVVYWTLVCEISFYGMVFLLLLFGQFKRVEAFAWGLALVSAGAWAATLAAEAAGSPLHGQLLGTLTTQWAAVLLIRHGSCFALGIALWLITFKGMTPARLALACAAFAGATIEVWYRGEAQFGIETPNGLTPSLLWAAGVGLVLLSIRFRDWRPRAGVWRYLGLLSFPLYLLHNVGGMSLMRLMTDRGVPAATAAYVAMAVAVLVSMAIVSWVGPYVTALTAWVYDRVAAALGVGARPPRASATRA